MAQLNVSMQVPNQNVYNIHHQIDTFKKTFLTPVVECTEAPEPLDDDNIKNIDNITFSGKNFTDFMSECEEQAHLTDGKRRKCSRTVYYKYWVNKVLDMVYMEESKESAVAFFSHLYNNYNEYSEFAKLCIHLLTISPDRVECERAISNLNTLKTKYRTCLTPRHLQDALRLALEKRSANEFPWKRLMNFAKCT